MNDPKHLLGRLSATEAATRLLGCDLIRKVDGHILSGRIVETEAYDESDPTSHSFRGITKRNSVMFADAGVAYIYFTYGMHYCLNIVTGPKEVGSAVLIRALEPLSGIDMMRDRRGVKEPRKLLSGPAKLTQALMIDGSLNGHDLAQAPLILKLNPPLKSSQICWCTRIGIKEEKDKINLWRAVITSSDYLSRPL